MRSVAGVSMEIYCRLQQTNCQGIILKEYHLETEYKEELGREQEREGREQGSQGRKSVLEAWSPVWNPVRLRLEYFVPVLQAVVNVVN